jgi:hypothetical protein
MPTPQETAYPTLKTQISEETLKRIYFPSASDVAFVENYSRFVILSRIPRRIPKYIAECIGCPYTAWGERSCHQGYRPDCCENIR